MEGIIPRYEVLIKNNSVDAQTRDVMVRYVKIMRACRRTSEASVLTGVTQSTIGNVLAGRQKVPLQMIAAVEVIESRCNVDNVIIAKDQLERDVNRRIKKLSREIEALRRHISGKGGGVKNPEDFAFLRHWQAKAETKWGRDVSRIVAYDGGLGKHGAEVIRGEAMAKRAVYGAIRARQLEERYKQRLRLDRCNYHRGVMGLGKLTRAEFDRMEMKDGKWGAEGEWERKQQRAIEHDSFEEYALGTETE